ncbi:MAG: HisS family protein, partial [Alphaproteobacteria bacterium]|nr:HisS family protein [Alphaproteobacteria bacterium]
MRKSNKHENKPVNSLIKTRTKAAQAKANPKRAKQPKAPKPRLPRGLQDIDSKPFTQQINMVSQLASLCEAHGFCALDTPALEYADVLGKFLPDAERPNEGVFALLDDDEQWLSLRYDLTAPLARYVAAHYDQLPKPFRRYQWGWVWRNEKPGLGRFRQFMQFDVDTVGASGAQADVEMCMLAADSMERLGIARGDYLLRVNNRKILDGILLSLGLDPDDTGYEMRRLTILRAMDKLDRLGMDAIRLLLGAGRKDESGDFTEGAGLGAAAIDKIV